MRISKAILSSGLILAALFAVIPAQAQTEVKAVKKRAAVLDVNYNRIESLGLYNTPGDGSLGRDLWDNTRRSFLVGFLPKTPPPSEDSFTHQRMVNGLLLSEANAGLIVDDIDIEPGKDILTLRLNRLIQMGAYKQAFDLYSKLGQEPYHSDLAKAGITAMLYNGERSLACLEYKTVQDRDFSDDFWADISLYCNYALNDEQDLDARNALDQSPLKIMKNIAGNAAFKLSYSAKRLSDLQDLERAILVAEGRLMWPDITQSFLENLPLEHLGILVAKTELSNSDRFLVLSTAANRGLVGNKRLKTFYTRVYDEELRQLENPQNQGWKTIPLAYHNIEKARASTEKWEHLRAAMDYMDTYGAGALIPFGQSMQTLEVEGQNESVVLKAVKVIESSGENLPGKWYRHYTQINPETNAEKKMRLISGVMSNSHPSEILQDPVLQPYFEKLSEKDKKEYFNIIENLDNGVKDIHNADAIYVNDFDLTFTERYVMPMPRVWNQLVNSSQDKRIGETVLLSTVMLHRHSLGDMYPGVAGDVLQSINTVGLTNISKAMALESVLDQQ